MSYKVDYSGQVTEQVIDESVSDSAQTIRYVEAPRRGFAFPSILKTTAVFLAGAAVLFTMETAAPEGYRPSTFIGTYDARITAAVKAAELQQQSRFDAWAANVKLAADQHAEQYKAVTQGVLTNYAASYDQAKIATQAAYEFQGRYASTIMGQKTQEQGADIGIINFMRGFGRIMNGLEAGAGDNALGYADDLSGKLQDEVTDAARKGAGTPVVDWARGLATPDEVAAKLASIQPLRLPPPPPMGEQRVTIGNPWGDR
ncbi:hypothetical protein [Sphingobium sp. HWE2-09]|uniref:hypothetical protein n=1 Tax=Sphingobium sp. HWE2-09 TaxID=3108390 RepID=UPI002DC4D63C|nr:hypothetical protein [Sphingobium sp. HWE2-09]